MTRKRLSAFPLLAACIGVANAQGAMGRLDFEGRVVQPTCGDSQPVPARGPCGPDSMRGIDESVMPPNQAADSALRDYFIERGDGDARWVLTRQYR